MKKNEYVSPEVEIVEITEKYGIMVEVSSPGGTEEGDPFEGL